MCIDNVYLYNRKVKKSQEQVITVALERCPATEGGRLKLYCVQWPRPWKKVRSLLSFMAIKLSLKKWICTTSNLMACIPSCYLSNVGKCFWSWILKDCIEVQEKKKKVVILCSCPPQDVKSGTFTSQSCSGHSKEMYRKVCCTCKFDVLLI